jgi:hypothetical protein
VYIKTDGKEVLITNNSDDTAYTQVTGAVLIAATESTKPVLWVKGLTAAVSGDAVAGKIFAGTLDVKVVITGGAQTGNVGDITAVVSGTAVVIDAQEYTLDSIAAGKIVFTAASHPTPAKVNWQTTAGNATGDTNLDPIFDAALIAVLTELEATDEITVGAKGIITGVKIVASAPTTAKINAVLGVHDNVTLGVDGAPDDDVTVPAGVTLTIAATKKLTVAAGKVLEVAGTLAFTDETSVLGLLGADGELQATATAKFHANATTTTGAGLSLTVTGGTVAGSATGWTSDDPSTGASVTVTSVSPASTGTGTAYVLGNASLAINNATTAHATDAVVSTAAGTPAVGGIKAASSSAVVITGKATS